MCTPVESEAMAIGFLYNESVIDNFDEVVDVRICEHGDNVDVWLNHDVEQPSSWRRTSGCSGGMTAVDSLTKSDTSFSQLGPKVPPDHIGDLVEQLFESQTLYRETGGVHTSALSDGQRILLSAEDIGRHNTLDKIAGLCLMKKIWPETRILITTGRISSEMCRKQHVFKLPFLFLVSPSSLS
jgi:FdhD protein